MIKHIIALVVLSLVMVLGLSYYREVLEWLMSVNSSLVNLLGHVFAGGKLGHLLQHSLALLLIPLVLGIVIGAIYWAIRKSQWVYLVHLVWIVWIILATCLAWQAG